MKQVIATVRTWGMAVSLATVVLFEVFASSICAVFLNTSAGNVDAGLATIGFAVMFLRIRCLAAPFQFLNYNTSFCMQAVGNGKATLLHACVRELVFYIPFMLILDLLFGTTGLAGALVAGELCGAVFALWLFHKQH